jgi:hypothetical protein
VAGLGEPGGLEEPLDHRWPHTLGVVERLELRVHEHWRRSEGADPDGDDLDLAGLHDGLAPGLERCRPPGAWVVLGPARRGHDGLERSGCAPEQLSVHVDHRGVHAARADVDSKCRCYQREPRATVIASPLTPLASSLARNTIVLATSSASTTRPAG